MEPIAFPLDQQETLLGKRGFIPMVDLLGKGYLDRFKVFYAQSLFPPNWELLKDYRCPICTNKLKFPKNKKIAYCNGKKHKRTFTISNKRLIEIVYK